MGFLDPKPQTQAGLDAATAAKINTPASATATALSATYAPVAVGTPTTNNATAIAQFAAPKWGES